MENNEIIILEFSQEQQLFHFKFEDEKPVLFSKWHTIGKIEINKAIEFCKMIDKKYKNKKMYFTLLINDLSEYVINIPKKI